MGGAAAAPTLLPAAMNTSSAISEGFAPDPVLARPSGERVGLCGDTSGSSLPLPPPADTSSPAGLRVVIEKKRPPPKPRADRGPLELLREDTVGPLPLKRAENGPLPSPSRLARPPPPTDNRPVKPKALLRNDASLLTERGVAVLSLLSAVVGERDDNAAMIVAAEVGSSKLEGSAPPAVAAVAAAAAFCLVSPLTFLLEMDFLALCRATRRREEGGGDGAV